ncbi:hypothetical protein INT45_012097 [Circinella minor]|uniref:Uncharacterized protein n=1 Tax=Circinella minor TaxID=1195481 RepID=A0A8H7VF40_9FUNG|nr:hypothetical protein INT45_012097 [Circinella minor]
MFIEKYKFKEIEIMMKEDTQFNGIWFSNQQLSYMFDEHAQLRQVKSKFDRLSTYLCYCFSSKFTNDVRTRPYTIWTIVDRSRNQDRHSSVMASSKFFKHIAAQVWDKGAMATLKLDFVKYL